MLYRAATYHSEHQTLFLAREVRGGSGHETSPDRGLVSNTLSYSNDFSRMVWTVP